jgi:hypothetical protein
VALVLACTRSAVCATVHDDTFTAAGVHLTTPAALRGRLTMIITATPDNEFLRNYY